MSTACLPVSGKFTRTNINQNEYGCLLSKSLPHAIKSEVENEHYTQVLEALDSKPRPTPAETMLAELLTLLIENFEEQHYALRRATPVESLIELMQVQNLKQKDLVYIFGTPSIVSEILNRKRQLTTTHIRKLSQRFHVPTELFI